MSTLEAIARIAGESNLEFIVCGGYAVNAYQIMRKTGDIDLVVRERQAPTWRTALGSLGYNVFHETGAFLQLKPNELTSWPIDLVVVDDSTFDAMKQAATPFRFGHVDCLIPSVDHLIAMKLHAIRSSPDRRMRQDALDILDLAERSDMDLDGDRFRDLCERYADEAIRERILAYAGKSPL
jgi:hypothetical protein